MNTTDGKIWLAIGVDNSELKRDAEKANQIFNSIGTQAEIEGRRIDDSFKRIGRGFAGLLSIEGARRFSSEIIKVRGEMELLEASFETLVGKAHYKQFISDLKDFAVESPLSLTGVSNAAQTLLGFNIEAEKVLPILRQLGDVSMGNEQRFSSLALAFAQTSSAGHLMGQDLLQMINAGFNPLQEISRKTGKSISELKEEMSAGAISAEMVADAFRTATEQGGKFHGMTQKQAEGIKGLQAELQGLIQETLNKIGTEQQGVITSGYKMAISLVENYERIGKTIAAIAATFGVYKAAVIAVNIVLKEQAAINAMVAASNGVFNKSLAAQWLWTERMQKAQKLLNKTMLTNPYVLAATAVAALAASIYLYTQRATAAERATKALNDQLEAQKQKTVEEKNELQSLIGTLNDETATRIEKQTALETLQKLMPSVFQNLDIEKAKTIDATDAARQYNEQLERRNYLENKQKVEAGQKLLASKEGDWRWTVKERQQALALMGQNSSRWNVLNTLPKDIISEFEQWVKQADRAVKDYEISVARARLGGGKTETKTTPTTPATEGKEKAKKAEYDATLEIMQAGVDAMIEGYEKQQAQIELNHEKRLQDIRKRSDELTKEEQAVLSKLSGTQRTNELNAINDEVLKKYQSYADKRLEIETKFENDRKELLKRSNIDTADETARSITQLEAEKSLALEQLAESATQNNKEFENFVKSIVGLSLTELQAKLASVWISLKMEIAKHGQTEKAAVLQAKYDELFEAIQKLSKESEKPVNEKGWSNTVKLMNSVRKSVEGITESFDGLDGETKSVLNAAANIAGGVISMISGVELLAKSGAEAIKGVERSSVILAVISAGLQIVTKIFSFLNKGSKVDEKVIENYNRMMKVTDELIDKQKELMSELSGTNAAIKAQQTLLTIDTQEKASRKLGKEYLESSKNFLSRDYGKKLQKELKDYKNEFAKVGINFDSLGGKLTGLFDLSIEQLERLKFESPLVWAKLGDDVTKYLNAIIETNKKRSEILSAENIAKIGLDLEDAKNSLDDFLMNADAGFEQVTNNWTKYTKNALLRAVKEQYLSKALQGWYDNFAKATEGGLTESETESLRKSYEAIAEEAKRRFDDMMRVAAIKPIGTQSAASYGEYEKITHEDAGKIDGRLTGIHIEVVSQSNIIKDIAIDTTTIRENAERAKVYYEEMRGLSLVAIDHLEKISKNTNELYETNRILSGIKKGTDKL